MGKRVAIVQSNYIPWKGYFDLIDAVDEFVFLDEVQYTRRDWRNRNRIKTPHGVRWLTIPVETKGRYHQRIDETRIADPAWAATHWRTLTHSYAGAPHFEACRGRFEDLYLGSETTSLSAVNRAFVAAICEQLGIDTKLTSSTEYEAPDGASERLAAISARSGADQYVSGPAARAYLDVDAFAAAGVEVAWARYGEYPQYEQPHPPFEHRVTVLDLLFSAGPEARRYMGSVELLPATAR